MATLALRRKKSAVWVVALAALIAAGCHITFDNPTPTGFKLGVPYYAQAAGSDYCGAASVLMWRVYRGGSVISQDVIYTAMGGSGSGVSPNAISNAVNTYAGEYTNVDYAGGIGDPDTLVNEFFSRQITAIDNLSPVIAIVNQGFHAGVIDGGSNHESTTTGLYVWDTVYFNDPDPVYGGADREYQAGSWQDTMCGNSAACTQIISPSASASGNDNYGSYGDQVTVRGGGLYGHQAYQY